MQTTWMYRSELGLSDEDLAGYDVEATDGSIGSIDESTTIRDHLIVDTGFWIFGKKRSCPPASCSASITTTRRCTST